MFYYKIKKANKDFEFLEQNTRNTKGSRKKRTIIDLKSYKKQKIKLGFFKYEKYNCSESCSEKIAYEIAKVLNKQCAEIEFAQDEKGVVGIISYLFVDVNNIKQSKIHIDAKDFFNQSEFNRKEFCTIKSIKKFLDKIDTNLFKDFLGIMVFDALIGETDRHEENWGLSKTGNKYQISPLYDNGCNLLREFKNKEIANKYYNGTKNFDKYILRSKTLIYKENGQLYKHMELIKQLYEDYPEIISKEIQNLNRLTDSEIKKILNKIPKKFLEKKHKEYIYIYVTKRRDILLSIPNKEGEKVE
jgi:hypothetical protein